MSSPDCSMATFTQPRGMKVAMLQRPERSCRIFRNATLLSSRFRNVAFLNFPGSTT
jgi:hypothetical protein